MEHKIQYNDPNYWDLRTKADELWTRLNDNTLTWDQLKQHVEWLKGLVEEQELRVSDAY